MAEQYSLVKLIDNLKLLRERNNLTTAEMAKIMKIGTTTYELLEQGTLKKSVKADSIFYIADYFKLEPADLFKCVADTL